MFDDLTKEIKAQLYERARSPLTGAFLISWSAWNFHPIAIFFSTLSYDEKVTHWQTYYSGNWDSVLFGFVYPLCSSGLFILLYPFPAKWAYHYWHWQHMQIKKIQQKLEDETPLTQEEANELRKSSILELSRIQQELRLSSAANSELTNQNRALLEQLALSKSTIQKLEKDLAAANPNKNMFSSIMTGDSNLVGTPAFLSGGASLNNLQRFILSVLGESENRKVDFVDQESILNMSSPKDIIAGKIAIQELLNKGLIAASAGGGYYLTHEGRLAIKGADSN